MVKLLRSMGNKLGWIEVIGRTAELFRGGLGYRPQSMPQLQ
jgi:hypothetical protein